MTSGESLPASSVSMLLTISFMASLPAFSARERLEVIPRVYASSMKSMPPLASSSTSLVLAMVPRWSAAMRSILSTSRNLGFLSMPSSWYTLARRRATAVLPVPGLPKKIMWGARGRPASSERVTPSMAAERPRTPAPWSGRRDSRRSHISVVRRSPRIWHLMCSKPTMLEIRSSTLSLTPRSSRSSIPAGSTSSPLFLLRFLTASRMAFSTAICCFLAASPALPPLL
mmetsp:Transcript_52433/g.111396  ORF Transcript_52433/g.111396 Transcript_52433/m.111396 type:complete len:228 (-) Transcript_52433:7-690(-)